MNQTALTSVILITNSQLNMTTTDNELTQLERQYWQALKERDAKACAELCDDPSILAGGQGIRIITREQMVNMIQKEREFNLEAFELRDMQTRMLSPEIGCVAYTVHEELTVEGKPVSFTAVDTSVWVKREDQWRCTMHTEAIQGDPFGRDRTGSSN